MSNKISLGEFIRKERKARGYTMIELAESLELTQGYVSKIETNKNIPSLELLKKIGALLEINYFDLMEAAGYFPAEDAAYRKEVFTESSQSIQKINKENEMLQQQMFQDLARLELGKFLLPETTTVLLDGIELTDDEKQQLLNVARAMFPKKA